MTHPNDLIDSAESQAPQVYTRAPLTEALLDIRVTLPDDVSLHLMERVGQAIEAEYPERETVVEGTFEVALNPTISSSASASQKTLGYRYWSTDRRQLVQARLDGFTFNRLAPYEDWVSFRDEAKRLWAVYREVVGPSHAVRIGLRYINRLNLPSGFGDFREYLNTLPEIASDIDTGLNSFFMRLVMAQADIDAVLFLTEALVPSPDPEAVSILLDIDVFRRWEIDLVDDDAMWAYFEMLRGRKNSVFEACITDEARKVII